jgi:glycosyltransferase involved in cell wall biosynthesis
MLLTDYFRFMNIIFLGGYFPSNRVHEIVTDSKRIIQNAANNLQQSIIKGLVYFYENLQLVTLPYIDNYPFGYKKCYFKSSYNKDRLISDYCIGFINISGLKLLHRYINAKITLKRLIKESESNYIVIYAIHTPFLKAAIDLKSKRRNVKICVIVPDLPQFMSFSNNIIYKIFKYIEIKILRIYLKKIDSFVFLTDYMAEKLEIDNKPWVRMEGIIDQNDNNEIVEKEGLKIILYTGTLTRTYGIMNLLNAFSAISNSEYRLWICGEGECREEIRKMAMSDFRIKYWGQLPYSEILSLQKKATVLVNPRSCEGEYTKYSFPSKIMEYMASGTPCIIFKLPGIPEEYLEYCFVIDNNDPDGLKNKIISICEMDKSELNEFGNKAKNFVITKKNPLYQVKKIKELISETSA